MRVSRSIKKKKKTNLRVIFFVIEKTRNDDYYTWARTFGTTAATFEINAVLL